MNDFERQLSNQPLRSLPPAWRAEILAGAAKVVVPPWTWRDWFWPSPIAWGALAAVWVGAFILGIGSESSPTPAMAASTPALSIDTASYAFARRGDLPALLDSLN